MEEARKRVMSGEKSYDSSTESLLLGVKAVVMDIEGTTTPISYIKDTIFPYIRENLKDYLEETYDEAQTQSDIEALRKFAVESDKVGEVLGVEAGKSEVVGSVLSAVSTLMDSDSKVTPLKQLQGHVWRYALDAGKKLSGLDVYDDVIAACEQLKRDSVDLYIFSSGSTEAQQLLFGRSSHGDLLKWFSGHFDTTIGAKGEKESYVKIAGEIKKCPEEILFLTDIPLEASAAREAGMKACLVVREGNTPLTTEHLNTYPVIHSFSQLFTCTASCGTDGEPAAKQAKLATVEPESDQQISTAADDADDGYGEK